MTVWKVVLKGEPGDSYTKYYEGNKPGDAATQYILDGCNSGNPTLEKKCKLVRDKQSSSFLNNTVAVFFLDGTQAQPSKIYWYEKPKAVEKSNPYGNLTENENNTLIERQQDAEKQAGQPGSQTGGQTEGQTGGQTEGQTGGQQQQQQTTHIEKYPSWFNDEGELLDWKSRWQLAKLKKIELEQRDMLKQQERRPDAINLENRYTEKEAAWNKVKEGNLFAIGEAILKELGFGVQYLGTHLSYIPRDMRDGMNMMAADLTIVGLTIERILDIIGKMWSIVAKLDGIGAFDLVEKYTKSINKSLEKGIEAGIIEKDGTLKPGWEKFAVPGVTGTNSATEIKQWLAVKELMRVPFIGSSIQTTLETQMLLNYENRTGVGIPDEDAWIKWILGNSGAYMPVQQATEIAGSIPDWFLIGKAGQITREIHAAEHRELQRHREDFRARNEAQRARLKNIHPWVKR